MGNDQHKALSIVERYEGALNYLYPILLNISSQSITRIGGLTMNYYHPTTLEHIRNPLPAVKEWAKQTAVAVPDYDPATQQCRFVDGAWAVETPASDPAARIAEIKTKITEIESKCNRDLRDITLGNGDIADSTGKTPRQYLADYDAQIVALRAGLKGLS